MSISLFGLTFHLYGMIVGGALAVGVLLAEKQAKKHHFEERLFWQVLVVLIVSGALGARLWHVFTDWHLYADRVWAIPQVWRGGLSIIGSFVGAGAGLLGMSYLACPGVTHKAFLAKVADLAVFGLPVAQAIGRIANFINQELYGLPTTLPWGIPISPEHRASQYAQYTHFHPLFAYEAIGMLLCAGVLWVIERKNVWQVGSGKYALLYTAWYGLFRGVLEFLRVEKSYILGSSLGVNQVILLGAGVVALFILMRDAGKTSFLKTLLITLSLGICFSACTQNVSKTAEPPETQLHSEQQLVEALLSRRDRERVPLQIQRLGDAEPLRVTVELVHSSASIIRGLSGRGEIGSDGMLFVFPESRRHAFWMKEMKFDLDMVWVLDGEVLEITANVPHPVAHTSDQALPRYTPRVPANMVLEIPAGMAAQWGLQPGDQVTLQ